MAQFDYDVRDSGGKSIRGTLNATTRERAARLLAESHYTIVGIYEQRPRWNFVADVRRFLLAWGYQRVGVRDMALFTRQLAMLLAAGVPIGRALESLHRQIWSSPYFNLVINDVLTTVLNGHGLSAALGRHRQVFSETYINLVRAGESSGGLVDILKRLSLYLERSYRLTQKLTSALVYPTLVFSVTILLVVLLCSYVFPLFLGFFDGMAIKMPMLALQMMYVATFITKPWVLLLLLLGAPVVFYQIHLVAKLPAVRRTLELYLYKNPISGPVFVAVASARFCRTAAILLECGLGQLQTLDLTGDVVGSTLVAEELEEMRESIVNGHGSFSTELLKTRFFPPICGHMISASEEAGGMPKMFDRLADFFDDRVEDGIARLLALIEPAMLLFMGLIVGGVLITVFQPIYALLESM